MDDENRKKEIAQYIGKKIFELRKAKKCLENNLQKKPIYQQILYMKLKMATAYLEVSL